MNYRNARQDLVVEDDAMKTSTAHGFEEVRIKGGSAKVHEKLQSSRDTVSNSDRQFLAAYVEKRS